MSEAAGERTGPFLEMSESNPASLICPSCSHQTYMGMGTWKGEKRLKKQEYGYHLPRETTKRDVFMQGNPRQASSRAVRTYSTVAYIYIYIPDGLGN